MTRSQIVFSKYSPLMAVDTPLTGKDGEAVETPRVCSLCRCGASEMKPFCDGSHSKVGFVGERENDEKAQPETYEGKEITIVFDRYLCMGNGACGELEAVFGTHDKPKYEPDAAPVGDIIATIEKCPSGALSYRLKDGPHTHYHNDTGIHVEKDGPLHVHGNVTLIDDQDSDKILPEGDHYVLCRCGASRKKPLCDGSHSAKGFKD